MGVPAASRELFRRVDPSLRSLAARFAGAFRALRADDGSRRSPARFGDGQRGSQVSAAQGLLVAVRDLGRRQVDGSATEIDPSAGGDGRAGGTVPTGPGLPSEDGDAGVVGPATQTGANRLQATDSDAQDPRGAFRPTLPALRRWTPACPRPCEARRAFNLFRRTAAPPGPGDFNRPRRSHGVHRGRRPPPPCR